VPDDARTGGSALVLGLHHFTIRCSHGELEGLRDFYCDVLGMREGPRPDFDFPGHWLYVGNAALLHLAAIVPDRPDSTVNQRMSGFDHVSLAGGQLDATRKALAGRGIAFEELPVPGWPLWQVFLHDPVGSKIELTFDLGPA
jgi:catechol 2,3-dioxygenase-like lactoylglutathione lyase family enzyme